MANRQFQDFLRQYNFMTESCFSLCVEAVTSNSLSDREVNCVNQCVYKHVNVNNRCMTVFMELQPEIVARRVEAAEKVQKEMLEKQSEEVQNTVA